MENLDEIEITKNLRKMRNEIVGNRVSKLEYFQNKSLEYALNLLPKLKSDDSLYVCLSLIKSFLECEEARSFLCIPANNSSFDIIFSIFEANMKQPKLFDICLTIFLLSSKNKLLIIDRLVTALEKVYLINFTESQIQIIACILKEISRTPFSFQKLQNNKDLIIKLIKYLYSNSQIDTLLVIIECLNKIIQSQEGMCSFIMSVIGSMEMFEKYIRHPFIQIQLASIKLIYTILKQSSSLGNVTNLIRFICPPIIKGFSDPNPKIKIKSISLLCKFVELENEFQKISIDIGAIEELSTMFKEIASDVEKEIIRPESSDKKQEDNKEMIDNDINNLKVVMNIPKDSKTLLLYSILKALSLLCYSFEDGRKKFIESKNCPGLINLLNNQEPLIRSFSCSLISSLGRSQKLAKTSIFPKGIPDQLFNLLHDEFKDIEENAIKAICNVSLEFQSTIAKNEKVMKRIIYMLNSKYLMIKIAATCTIKNLLYMASREVKKLVLTYLTNEKILNLIDDEELSIQIQGCSIVRNLLYKTSEDIMEFLDSIGGENLIKKLCGKLNLLNFSLITQCLYCFCNIASANDKEKAAIANTDLFKFLPEFLKSSDRNLKVATLWLIINLFSKSKKYKELIISKLEPVTEIIESIKNDPVDIQLQFIVKKVSNLMKKKEENKPRKNT